MLYRFQRHYDSINKYMSVNLYDEATIDSPSDYTSSYMKTVHMHMPNRQSRNYIDALLAFWPGLQILKGDVKGAIKFHESLHQIVRKHDFLPEAVLFDHTIYWSNHLLRPEFLESTYFLYKATKDDFYLQIAKKMIEQLEKHSRVKCGYAAIADLKTKHKEDRLDSFVYAETFKYLYLMFVEDGEIDMKFDIDDFIFSTEAHLIPLDMNSYVTDTDVRQKNVQKMVRKVQEGEKVQNSKDRSCPCLKNLFSTTNITDSVHKLRETMNPVSQGKCKNIKKTSPLHQYTIDSTNIDKKYKQLPLRATDFVAGRLDHIHIISKMGIKLETMNDGRIQLVHKSNGAQDLEQAELGILFMTDMFELSKKQNFRVNVQEQDYKPLNVILLNNQEMKQFQTGTAQFGYNFTTNHYGLFGSVELAEPFDGCSRLNVSLNYADKIILAKRGNCMFIEKAMNIQASGAMGLIIIDNNEESTFSVSPLFSMSGDGKNDQNIHIPVLFLFGKEGKDLIFNLNFTRPNRLFVYIGDNTEYRGLTGVEQALAYNHEQLKTVFNYKKYSPLNLCDKISYYFSIKKSRRLCELNEYQELQDFYHIISKTKLNTNTSNKYGVTKIELDDVISIELSETSDRKFLHLNLEPVIKKEKDLREKMFTNNNNNSDKYNRDIYTQRIFTLLFRHFERNTNIHKFKNLDLYTNTLFNYVNWHLNPERANFTEQDQLVFEMLAHDIDSN